MSSFRPSPCKDRQGVRKGAGRLALVSLTLVGALALCMPAAAQTLGGQYYALTTVATGGYYNPATGHFEDHSTASGTLDPYPLPTIAQYGSQVAGSTGKVTASADDTHGGTVTARAAIDYTDDTHQGYVDALSATAQITYTFLLDGANIGAKVPVLLDISGLADNGQSGGLGASASAGYTFHTLKWASDDDIISLDKFTDVYGRGGRFGDTLALDLTVGDIYTLFLGAAVTVGRSSVSPDNPHDEAIATVDPLFTIGGGYARLDHFVGLPGAAIGGTSPVPEPASWALMILGLGAIGAASRRRRAVSTMGPQT